MGDMTVNGHKHTVSSIEEQSQTSLEQDTGVGQVAVIRRFTFKANPDVFAEHPPTKQDLFNHHLKGIEIALWRDGLKMMPEVKPRLVFDDDKGTYSIVVGSTPSRGQTLQDIPKTLSELVHGS